MDNGLVGFIVFTVEKDNNAGPVAFCMSELLYELFSHMPRQGPGDRASTLKALEYCRDLPRVPMVLDIECGTGVQTLVLARALDSIICAVDDHRPYLDILNREAKRQGLSGRVCTKEADMRSLPFEEEKFDLIWSEGAIFVIGFEEGLREWARFLKNGGYMAVSEVTWTSSDIPDELKDFWDQNYPQMKGLEENLEIMERCGYELKGHFQLPDSAWTLDLYDPLQRRIGMLRERWAEDPEGQELLDSTQKEIDMFGKYSDRYGYVFYIMRRPIEI